jgi:hypothetical protein
MGSGSGLRGWPCHSPLDSRALSVSHRPSARIWGPGGVRYAPFVARRCGRGLQPHATEAEHRHERPCPARQRALVAQSPCPPRGTATAYFPHWDGSPFAPPGSGWSLLRRGGILRGGAQDGGGPQNLIDLCRAPADGQALSLRCVRNDKRCFGAEPDLKTANIVGMHEDSRPSPVNQLPQLRHDSSSAGTNRLREYAP